MEINYEISKAMKSKDLQAMKRIFKANKKNDYIKYSYARLLLIIGGEENEKLSRKYFDSLTRTSFKDKAILALSRFENEEDAKKIIDSVDTTNSNSLKKNALKIKAEYAMCAGNYNEALGYYKEIQDTVHSISYSIMSDMAKCYFYLKKYDEAKTLYFKLCEVNKVKYLIKIALIEKMSGNNIKSKYYLKDIINHDMYGQTEYQGWVNRDLFFLNISLGEYKEALENYKYIDKGSALYNTAIIQGLVYICKNLNVFNDDIKDITVTYGIKQICNYQHFLAREHIFKHENAYLSNPRHSVFNKNINSLALYTKYNKNLDKKYFSYNRLYDFYLIPYDNIGTKGENTLVILTLPNTNDIITMYPDNYKNLCDDELMDSEEQNKQVLVKNYEK